MQIEEEIEISPSLSAKAIQDIQLVQAATEGNQQAFADLMDRYRDSVYFMLLKIVKNKSDADDLTIEAFGKAFKNLHQYTPNFAFSTWLFKIASNNCIDFLRKRKNNTIPIASQEESEYTELPIPSEDLDPEEDMIRQQKARLMRSVVDKLKPRYKELVTLRYFDELSYEEIADKMNIPIGTVKAQLFRSRELLYQIINKNQETI